jgi:hypothetical protein
MEAYCKLVMEYYKWDPNNSSQSSQGTSTNMSSLGGNSVSSFAKSSEESDELDPEYKNTIFEWVRDNDLKKIQKWLLDKVRR